MPTNEALCEDSGFRLMGFDIRRGRGASDT